MRAVTSPLWARTTPSWPKPPDGASHNHENTHENTRGHGVLASALRCGLLGCLWGLATAA